MYYYVVDAFTNKNFRGNPAGVCILDKPLDNEVLQSIAYENNLAETAFILKKGYNYELRWFTPKLEIDLCGHATLASAYVVFNYMNTKAKKVEFHTISGILKVEKKNDLYEMNFPSRNPEKIERTIEMQRAIGARVSEAHLARDLMLVVEDEDTVRSLNPNMDLISKLPDCFGVIVTAKGEKVDFVSRFFCPDSGIGEDYVTGSAHTTLIPYWANVLDKNILTAKQLSEREGTLYCENLGSRVKIAGKAKIYLKGEIMI